MLKGGYQIIDLENNNFTPGTAITINSIYDKCEGTTKPYLLTNIKISSKEYGNTFIELKNNESNFTGQCYGYNVTITNSDSVTFTAIGG